MNRQQFAEFIRNPQLADASSIPMLEDLLEEYPYCQSAQLLFAFNLHRADNLRYPVQLKVAAAYAGDRRALKVLMESAISPPELPPVNLPAQVKPDEGVHEKLTREKLLAIVKKRLAEINSMTGAQPGLSEDSGNYEKEGAVSAPSAHRVSKHTLIEKFIRDEPRISKPQAAFFSPSESAIRSNYDDEEIVSETLAQLYAEQGNPGKAIHIYQKLSLLNQEKSRYFAAQIEKLSF